MASINDSVLVNFRGVRDSLASLPGKVAKKVARQAVYAGAKEIRDAARARVPVDTGALKARIVVKNGEPKPGKFAAHVGIAKGIYAKGKMAGKNPRRYAHLVEFGTPSAPAQPFLRPALDAAAEDSIEVVASFMRKGIAKEIDEGRRGQR